MSAHAIAAVLGGQIPLGRSATVQGWVRTRRDSKAGLSFVTLHDGSGFEPLQVIVPAELPNYQSEVLHLTAGCAIRVTGELVASAGKGQAVELRAETIEVVGGIEDPKTYPIAPKPHSFEYLRTVFRKRVWIISGRGGQLAGTNWRLGRIRRQGGSIKRHRCVGL